MAGAQCKLVCNCDHDRQNVCEGLNLSRRSEADSRGSQDRVRANEWQKILVAMRLGATPVPIPNPMVLHWRRCGRVGGRQIKKRKNEGRSAAEV